MKLVISSQGASLDSPSSTLFGRCPTFVFVDSETMEFEAIPNPAMSQGGGAGIQAAQFVVEHGAQAVLSGHLGPNAFDVLSAAGVPGYLVPEGSVRQAVRLFDSGELKPMAGASVAAHSGMGGGRREATPGATRSQTKKREAAARRAELAELRDTLKALRQQLAATMESINKLEKEA
jgi:predicted Fe-Mo cluster-binding NifX family protein